MSDPISQAIGVPSYGVVRLAAPAQAVRNAEVVSVLVDNRPAPKYMDFCRASSPPPSEGARESGSLAR